MTFAADLQVIKVERASSSLVVDGDVSEWSGQWNTIALTPAMEGDRTNYTGDINVELIAAVYDHRIYVAAKWPDNKVDVIYKEWEWQRNKYKRGKKLDDMFALRFHMSGDYDYTMISEKTYEVDVWIWSAGRSNLAGYAEDTAQLITTEMLEDAAEYKGPTGKQVFIKKYRDAGNSIYKNTRPDKKKNQGKSLPGIMLTGNESGSVADVKAKGVWKDGYWYLEMSRALDTGHKDDVVLKPGQSIIGAIAVYNRARAEHKSVSQTLQFELAK
ncbi:MAG: hypothetical protein ISR96_13195 [Nitrospira sp.]|nr:hypothetical protein [bacterium]MBL7050463.1 hypothetical protein [Nitrospira sp.]